jgi:pimeloyl-ACP methyl ester carboxylesterase
VSDRFVSAGGLRLAIREEGSKGHPLLMVNGLGGNVDMWGPAQRHLAGNARTIAFDAPGTGRSERPLLPMTISAVARTVVKLLDELELEQVDVLGYSWGGLLSQRLAYIAPDRVRRLALAGTGVGWGGIPGDPRALALIATPLRYYSRTFYERTSDLLDGHDAREDASARLANPPSVRGYYGQVLAGSRFSSLPWVHRIQAPTLILTGDRDKLVPPANARLLARRLPHAELRVLPGEGHLLLFNEDSAALPLLTGFFTA